MGAELSIPLECTNFDTVEVKRLAKRFKKLDIDNSGSISPEEFMQLPELRSNPIVPRVINIFDKGTGQIGSTLVSHRRGARSSRTS